MDEAPFEGLGDDMFDMGDFKPAVGGDENDWANFVAERDDGTPEDMADADKLGDDNPWADLVGDAEQAPADDWGADMAEFAGTAVADGGHDFGLTHLKKDDFLDGFNSFNQLDVET